MTFELEWPGRRRGRKAGACADHEEPKRRYAPHWPVVASPACLPINH